MKLGKILTLLLLPRFSFVSLIEQSANQQSCYLIAVCGLFLMLILWSQRLAALDDEQVVDMDIEELLNVEVVTASKFSQTKLAAPSAVTVITANDIKTYGYRTLAEAMRSIRGIYTSYDRVYDYFGSRGFGRSGDYNSRLLLMLDGRRINDAIYDQAFIGTDGLIDMEDIERIEFVPGSGSSIYGSNAVQGVMNIITKSGAEQPNLSMAGGFGDYGADREKATVSKQFDNGLGAYATASRYRNDGHQRLYFPEFNSGTSTGVAENLDGDKAERYFGKLTYQGWTLEGAFSNRKKYVPTAIFDADFNASQYTIDKNALFELRYEDSLSKTLNITSRIFYGSYQFDALYHYDGVKNFDKQRADWVGTEFQVVADVAGHKLVMGSEYQNNFSVLLANFNQQPYFSFTDETVASERYGFYVQDNVSFLDYFTLNAGVRFDHYSVFGDTVNPRLALIVQPESTLAVKFLYGTAYRAPNLYERFWRSDAEKISEHLGPEKTESFEAVLEYQPMANLRLITTGFHNTINNLIQQALDPRDDLLQYINAGSFEMNGFELEADYLWVNGMRLRGSYGYSEAREASTQRVMENSPLNLAKLNFSVPFYHEQLLLGAEWQYYDGRKAKSFSRTQAYQVFNLTLTATKLVPHLDLSASIYNLFDEHYQQPAGDETQANVITQDGRNFRVWFTCHF